MELKIRQYIEELFSTAPQNSRAYDMREEIIRNTIERYHDHLGEGKSEQEAYSAAIDGIGDVRELFAELGESTAISDAEPEQEPEFETRAFTSEEVEAVRSRKRTFISAAVALYITCVTPVILLASTPLSEISPAFMFFMISIATGLIIYSAVTRWLPVEQDAARAEETRRRGLMKAVAVGLFISCVTPPILFSNLSSFDGLSVTLMFVMIAAGVVLIILSRKKNPDGKKEYKSAEKNGAKTAAAHKRPLAYKLITAGLWTAASAAFILFAVLMPLTLGAAWLVFPLAFALQGLAAALFDYMEATE